MTTPTVSAVPLQDVAHQPATPHKVSVAPPPVVTAPVTMPGPVIPEVGVPVQRSPLTAEPPVVHKFPSAIDGLDAVTSPPVPPAPVVLATPEAAPAAGASSGGVKVSVAPPPQVQQAQPEAPAPEPQVDPRVSGGPTAPPVIAAPSEPEPVAPPNIAPSVLKRAEKYGIDVSQLIGTGSGGRIIGRDVDAAIAARSAVASNADPATAPVVEPAPVVDAAPTVPVVEAAAAEGAMVELRIKLTQRLTLSDPSGFADLVEGLARQAHDVLPNLMIGTITTDFTPNGNYLLVQVAQDVAVEL